LTTKLKPEPQILRDERRRKMKFLTIGTMKDTFFALPPATSRQLAEAGGEWMKQKRQAGTILETYMIPGWRRSVIICQHESAEDVVKTLTGMPMFAFFDFELYPLADFDECLGYSIEALKRAGQ
jgi:muconolactone delta-isomerase